MRARFRTSKNRPAEATTELDPAIREFLAELENAKSHSNPSVFWQQQLNERAAYDTHSDEDVTELAERVARGYGFEALPDDVAQPNEDPAYRAALDALKRMRAAAAELDPKRKDIDKGTWEHLRALGFLHHQRLLDAYLAFIAPMRVRSTMSVARHWYYAQQVDEWSRELYGDRPLDILEVGAGAGNLGVMLARMGRVASYTIVDLPQMLVHSAFTAWRHVEGAELRFEVAPSPGTWTFVSDGRAASTITGESFDLCLNFNSFMEMDREARDGYLELIYRTARPGALFYNVNRRQRALPLADGSTWDNNPMLYPYRPSDDVLVWEEDPFQTVTRGKWGVRPTLAVARAARLG